MVQPGTPVRQKQKSSAGPLSATGSVMVDEASCHAEPWLSAADVEVQHALWRGGRSQAGVQEAQRFCHAAASMAAWS